MHLDAAPIRFSRHAAQTSRRRLGTWKLAYADFLTALCAFFLVMWLVHGVAADDKTLLAQQFGSDAAVQSPADSRIDTLIKALDHTTALDPYRASLRVIPFPDALRLELTDGPDRPLFDRGDGRLNTTGLALIRATGRVLANAPVLVRIEGHTDSTPIEGGLYSNWELSSDRAHAARRLLIDAGLPDTRIREVAGLADTHPLKADKPHLPANRRISIVLFFEPSAAGA